MRKRRSEVAFVAMSDRDIRNLFAKCHTQKRQRLDPALVENTNDTEPATSASQSLHDICIVAYLLTYLSVSAKTFAC